MLHPSLFKTWCFSAAHIPSAKLPERPSSNFKFEKPCRAFFNKFNSLADPENDHTKGWNLIDFRPQTCTQRFQVVGSPFCEAFPVECRAFTMILDLDGAVHQDDWVRSPPAFVKSFFGLFPGRGFLSDLHLFCRLTCPRLAKRGCKAALNRKLLACYRSLALAASRFLSYTWKCGVRFPGNGCTSGTTTTRTRALETEILLLSLLSVHEGM